MADDQRDAGPARCGDHFVAVVEGKRHRLLDDGVLAVLRSKDNMFTMELMRCRNVDRVDIIAANQLSRAGGDVA